MVGTGANNFEIGIAHRSTVKGRIVDEDGKPIAGVFVYVAVNQVALGEEEVDLGIGPGDHLRLMARTRMAICGRVSM